MRLVGSWLHDEGLNVGPRLESQRLDCQGRPYLFSTSSPSLAICHLVDKSHSYSKRWYLIIILIFISLIISDTEHPFSCLLPSICLLRENAYLVPLLIFKLHCLFFWCWVVWVLCYRYLPLIRYITCKCLLPFSRWPFHFVASSLHCESLSVWRSPTCLFLLRFGLLGATCHPYFSLLFPPMFPSPFLFQSFPLCPYSLWNCVFISAPKLQACNHALV